MTPEALRERVPVLVPGATLLAPEDSRGQVVVVVPRERLRGALETLRDHDELRCEMLADLTVVDYLGRVPRFEVVYELHSLAQNHRIRVKVLVPEEEPVVPTAAGVWKSALWAEREAWDMFGIHFDGHPDLRRILMYPEFVGHPLRKDYPVAKRQPLVPERDPITNPWPARRGV